MAKYKVVVNLVGYSRSQLAYLVEADDEESAIDEIYDPDTEPYIDVMQRDDREVEITQVTKVED